MGVISLSHFTPNINFSMSDATKHLVNNGNLYLSYGLVVMLVGLTWFFADKTLTMQSEINLLKIDQKRQETSIEVIRTQMITKESFDYQMTIFNLKLDRALEQRSNK